MPLSNVGYDYASGHFNNSPRRPLTSLFLTDQDKQKAPNDAVWCTSGIAAVIDRTETATRHLIRSSALDGAVKKVGGRYTGYPSKIREKLGG